MRFVGFVNSAQDPLVCTEKSKVMAQPCVNSAQQCTWSPKVETHAKKEKKMKTQNARRRFIRIQTHTVLGAKRNNQKKEKAKGTT